jgi:FkbM family methyltransferase
MEMEAWKTRAARFVSRFITFIPLVRALMKYLPAAQRKRVWTYICDDKLALHHHHFTVRTEYGRFTGDSADLIPQYVYYFGHWEPVVSELISRRLRPGQTFIDVGANTGWYTLLAAHRVGPTGRVVAIEPSPANFSWLSENVKRNRLGNVHLVNEAAWSGESELPFFQGPASSSAVSSVMRSFAELKGCEQRAQMVRARPLATLLTPDEVSSMRVLKIDVEGAELEVVRGLEPVLDSAPNDLELFLELNPGQYDVEELLQVFRKRGFRAWIIPNEYAPNYYLNFSRANLGVQLKELLSLPDSQIDVLLTRTPL